jgi:arylsulfatase A-like enzyme
MFPPEILPPIQTGQDALDIKGFKFKWCRNSFKEAFPDYEDQIQRARSNYMGMLRLLDDQVKRFVEFLDQEGLRENTIIVILSDHGDFVGEYGLLRKGPELPEMLTRIPLQLMGPGICPLNAPHNTHVSITDIFPTLCEAVGVPIPDGVQGRSLWQILTGQDYPPEEFESAYVEQGFGGLHYTGEEDLDPEQDGLTRSRDGNPGAFDCLNSWTQSGTMRMVRKGDWKLVYDMQGSGQLYNSQTDTQELTNLYEDPDYSSKCRELLEALLTWRLRVEDPLPLLWHRYIMKRHPRNWWTNPHHQRK